LARVMVEKAVQDGYTGSRTRRVAGCVPVCRFLKRWVSAGCLSHLNDLREIVVVEYAAVGMLSDDHAGYVVSPPIFSFTSIL
jgi:hypothetical protein